MSQARVYVTQKVRKDWTCGKCGAAIRKGQDGRRSFAVGFRGFEQTRCMKPECTPTRSELESSAVASVYAAIDGIDFNALYSKEDIETAVQEVADAISEVADEYENNEMYDINTDLQDRAEQLRSAEGEVDGWEFDGDDEPEEDDERFGVKCEACDGHGTTENDEADCEECGGKGYTGGDEVFEDAHSDWLESVREAAREAVEGLELP